MTLMSFITIIFFVLLVGVGIAIGQLRSLFAAVMLSGIFSLLSAALFVLMDAVDVAFTEAAVGAGISTVLMLMVLYLTSEKEAKSSEVKLFPLLIAVLCGAVLLYATHDMPHFGDPDAYIHKSSTTYHYLYNTYEESHIPNTVTTILASYRGYDTLGETTVVLTAAISVMMLMGRRKEEEREIAIDKDTIIDVGSKMLTPYILLFALYVQFHGDFGPGGGFQAGVMFAAAYILHALGEGVASTQRAASARVIEKLIPTGVLIYAGVGVWCLLKGGKFLEYNVLSPEHPAHGQHLGILLVELGVGITVCSAMLMIFYKFALRGKKV
jgi:multicomponent Na+:H+ antiporter subunit B